MGEKLEEKTSTYESQWGIKRRINTEFIHRADKADCCSCLCLEMHGEREEKLLKGEKLASIAATFRTQVLHLARGQMVSANVINASQQKAAA